MAHQEGSRPLRRPAGPRLALAGRLKSGGEPAVPDGIEGQGVNLMADNGCQPTSLAFMRACTAMGIRQAFTSYSNPKGNADTERFLRTLKEELVWLHEWTSPAVFFAALGLLDRRLQPGLPALGPRLPFARGLRSPTPQPRHHLTGRLLNRQQYNGVGLGKTFVGLMLIERLVLREGKRVALFAPKGSKEGVGSRI